MSKSNKQQDERIVWTFLVNGESMVLKILPLILSRWGRVPLLEAACFIRAAVSVSGKTGPFAILEAIAVFTDNIKGNDSV